MYDELGDSIREEVWAHFIAAETTNHRKFIEGDSSATSEYIYENQKEDSQKIITEFKEGKRVVSVQKRTKVGADGLMICVLIDIVMESGELFTNPKNVRIITGMSNCEWEKGMIEKCPGCFKDKIFHHGQLQKANLKNLKNALIIIDEIDTGNKEDQVLHKILKDSGVLNVKFMTENNIRFIFISATIIRELHELYRWGSLHGSITMSVPKSYISHGDFLRMGIIQEFYSMKSINRAEKWINSDILPYGNDYRVHIIRTTEECVGNIQDACIKNEIEFKDHNAFERLSTCELKELFEEPLKNHMVICVKGFYRRANLIPNKWKLRIGATHELYTKTVDNNVQVQGLPGRMTGYWKEIIESGHKTGPYRTSVKAITQYENSWQDPFGYNEYHTSGFNKNSLGKVNESVLTFLNPKHIQGLVPIDLPEPIRLYDISGPFSDCENAEKWCNDNLVKRYTKWTHSRYDKNGKKNPSGDYIKLGASQCCEPVKILKEKDTRALSNIFWGTNTEKGCAITRPVLDNETNYIKYIVIYSKKLLK
jgi:hypothetical protein